VDGVVKGVLNGAVNVPCNNTTEYLGTPVRKFTDKMLGWSDIHTAPNYTSSAYICNRGVGTDLFIPSHLRCFLAQ